ncbi:phage regulatory CII family protein [Halomonas salifodinae]|uniref:Phage regulatory CII family protein n=1 Tax=Halomonas salifodinae TaxID=438745 RepID=A0ABW2F411_9GAMM
MDLYTAGIQQVVKEAGYATVARELRMDEGRLHKKLDPDGTVPLTLADFIRIAVMMRDPRAVTAILDEMGLVAVPVERPIDDASLCDRIIHQQVAVGNVAQEVQAALADGKVDANEAWAIDRAVDVAIEKLCALRSELKEMAEPKVVKG